MRRIAFAVLSALSIAGVPGVARAQPADSHENAVGAASAPVCQWGNCVSLCQQPCSAGTVCGVDGTCVQVANRDKVEEELKQAEEDARDRAQERKDAMKSEARRQRARYLMRASIGGGLGGVSLLAGQGKAGLFVGQVGMRQQLNPNTGLHLQLIGNLGLRSEEDATGKSSTLTPQEAAAAADVYLGPFRHFYVGPSALAGYRWYSEEFVKWFAPEAKVHNHVVREGGLRLGLLVGTEEQFDISALITSSFDDDTPLRGQISFAYEFR